MLMWKVENSSREERICERERVPVAQSTENLLVLWKEGRSCRHTKQLVDASNRRKHTWGSCPINTFFKPNILDDWCPKCPARVSCHETLGEQQVEGHSQLLLTISLSGMYGLISFDKFMEHDGGWNCTLPPLSPKLAFEDLKLTMCFSTCSEPTPEKKRPTDPFSELRK